MSFFLDSDISAMIRKLAFYECLISSVPLDWIWMESRNQRTMK